MRDTALTHIASTSNSAKTRWLLTLFALTLVTLWQATAAAAAPKADLWPRWEAHDASSERVIDHSPWNELLGRYVAPGQDGIHLVAYVEVTPEDRKKLVRYLDTLQAVPISRYARDEQMAYWINLYNALTVRVILDHYPVDSIRDIDISGWLKSGPWDADLAEVEGEELTLNDIEHRILRPIWKDPRIHYAVNCASLGCPDLAAEAFTGAEIEPQLDRAARSFVNHPRGARFERGKLWLSSIYDWYGSDFGASDDELVEHLRGHAEGDLARRLDSWDGGRISHGYDWNLNEP